MLKDLLTKFCKSIFYVSAVNCYFTYIFKGSNYRFSGLLFRIYFKNSYFDASISNYMKIEFLDFLLYWCYMFNLYNFIFQRLIWEMISIHFLLWFDYWTLKEWKLQKYRIILSQPTNYLHKWLVLFFAWLLLPEPNLENKSSVRYWSKSAFFVNKWKKCFFASK